MEPRKHYKTKQRRNALRTQKCTLSRSKYLSCKRGNGSYKRKQKEHSKRLTYNKQLKLVVLKLHKRGYNLLGYRDNWKNTTGNGLSEGSHTLFKFHQYYLKEVDLRKIQMAFLLLFLFYRHLCMVHNWNTDLLPQITAFLFFVPLVQLLVCNYHIVVQLLAQTLNTILNLMLKALPVVTWRIGVNSLQTGASCRQQHLQGYRSDSSKCRIHQWLCMALCWLGTNLAVGQNLNNGMPQSQPDQKKYRYRKHKARHLISRQHLRVHTDLGKFRKQGNCFRKDKFSKISNALVYPTKDDLSGFFKRLESQPPPDEAERMQYEWERLQTFTNCKEHVSGVRLAKSGFYFAGNADNPCLTRCYSCRLENTSWDYFSDVEGFHRKHSPHCKHLASMNAAGLQSEPPPTRAATTPAESANGTGASEDPAQASTAGAIPKTSTQKSLQTGHWLENSSDKRTSGERQVPVTKSTGMSAAKSAPTVSGSVISSHVNLISASPSTTCSVTGWQNDTVVSARVNDHQRQTIEHLEYQSYEDRRRSFTTWPLQIDPSPRVMAEAGFYYTGIADRVSCFYCGVCCCDWNDGESAWMEHAVGNIECPFLRQMKESAFFERARKEIAGRRSERRRPIGSGSRIAVPEQDIDPMATNTAKVLMDLKIPSLLAKQAVQHVWREMGGFTECLQMAMNWSLDQMEKESKFSSASGGQVETHMASLTVSRAASSTVIRNTNCTILYTGVTSVVTVTSALSTSSNAQGGAAILKHVSEEDQETNRKHLQESSSSRQPRSLVETVTATDTSSQVIACAPTMYTAAGQQNNTDAEHDLKITEAMKILFEMGFTFATLNPELLWMQYMKDSPVEEIVEMAVIRMTGRMKRDATIDMQIPATSENVAHSVSKCPESAESSVCSNMQILISSERTKETNTASVSLGRTQGLTEKATSLQIIEGNRIQPVSTTGSSLSIPAYVSDLLSGTNSSACVSTSITQEIPLSTAQAGGLSLPLSDSAKLTSHANVTVTICQTSPIMVSSVQTPVMPYGQAIMNIEEPAAVLQIKNTVEQEDNITSAGGASGGPKDVAGDALEKKEKKKRKPPKMAKHEEKPVDAAIDPNALAETMLQVMEMKKSVEKVKERSDTLQEENEQLKEKSMCKVCMDREVAIVFLPCGHLVTCEECSRKIDVCPMCRRKIKQRKKTFSS